MDYQQFPIGFGLSLAMNQRAMDKFTSLTEAEKEKLIARSRNVNSKNEMDSLVGSLAENDEVRLRSLFEGTGLF